MSGSVTCSSSPSLAKSLSLRACSRALVGVGELLADGLHGGDDAAAARPSWCCIASAFGLELGELLLEARARVHARPCRRRRRARRSAP